MQSLLKRVIRAIFFWVYSLMMGSLSLSLGMTDTIDSFPQAAGASCVMDVISESMQKWALNIPISDDSIEACADRGLNVPGHTRATARPKVERTRRDARSTQFERVHEPINQSQRGSTVSKQGNGSFKISAWDETPHDESDNGPNLTQAHVEQTYAGAIEGKSTIVYLMMYREEETAHFVGYEHVTGTIDGKQGSFKLKHRGAFKDRAISEVRDGDTAR